MNFRRPWTPAAASCRRPRRPGAHTDRPGPPVTVLRRRTRSQFSNPQGLGGRAAFNLAVPGIIRSAGGGVTNSGIMASGIVLCPASCAGLTESLARQRRDVPGPGGPGGRPAQPGRWHCGRAEKFESARPLWGDARGMKHRNKQCGGGGSRGEQPGSQVNY